MRGKTKNFSSRFQKAATMMIKTIYQRESQDLCTSQTLTIMDSYKLVPEAHRMRAAVMSKRVRPDYLLRTLTLDLDLAVINTERCKKKKKKTAK